MLSPNGHPTPTSHSREAFTRIDLIAAIAMVTALTLLVLPRLSRGSIATLEISCIENHRRAVAAWQQYASDHTDRLVNNFTLPETLNTINNGQYDTWAHNVVDWTINPRNTNLTYLQNSKLYPYLKNDTAAFKCPADTFLATAQRTAGWTRRVRSFSMNAFMGKTSTTDSAVNTGLSSWEPGNRQFLKSAAIPSPANTLVFIDEHPDSINDGFFIQFTSQLQWTDLPASYHNGGVGFSNADGSAGIKTWSQTATKVPVRYSYFAPSITPATSADYRWVTARLTVPPTALAVNRRTNRVEIAWSAIGTNYMLESTADLSALNWTPINSKPITDYGTKAVALEPMNAASFFRLRRY